MDATMMSNEAGASDNRMSLGVGDYPFIKDWKDGEEYNLTVTVRQSTTGEYQIVKAVEAGAPAEGEAGAESETAPETAQEGDTEEDAGAYPNPAVAGMMRKK